MIFKVWRGSPGTELGWKSTVEKTKSLPPRRVQMSWAPSWNETLINHCGTGYNLQEAMETGKMIPALSGLIKEDVTQVLKDE